MNRVVLGRSSLGTVWCYGSMGGYGGENCEDVKESGRGKTRPEGTYLTLNMGSVPVGSWTCAGWTTRRWKVWLSRGWEGRFGYLNWYVRGIKKLL